MISEFQNKAHIALQNLSREVKGQVIQYRNENTIIQTYLYNGALQSIEIEKIGGNNKFFGYGVCQTTTIKLLDRDRNIDIQKGDKLHPQFTVQLQDGTLYEWCTFFPYFYVTEIQRDEITNVLTVTAVDRLYNLALQQRVKDLNLTTPYTIQEFAAACAKKIETVFYQYDAYNSNEFSISYAEGANFDGAETIREALDAIAEATQTVYFLRRNELFFRSVLNSDGSGLPVDKSEYFTLDVKKEVTLTAICSTNALGDSVIAYDTATDARDKTQYVRDNPFWDADNVATRVNNAMEKLSQQKRIPYTITWRGNYYLEPTDWIWVASKEQDKTYQFPLSNCKITYDGGYRETLSWDYEEQTSETVDNPSTLGEAIKQTYAQVDKANKQIELVASETQINSDNISTLLITTREISGNVSSVQRTLEETSGEVEELKKAVNASITEQDVTLAITTELSKGTSKVITETGFKFDSDGLTVSKSGSEMSTTITEDGMQVFKDNSAVLTANNVGVDAVNLHATTYLIIGGNSRFEDFGSKRTGCFWIGG